ncbi:MAG: CHAD domain-containing protein [Caldilinea sp. CFX5]|nr:CHAD domain-containing protein [Caldilinea sp. CFX5]
MKNINNNDRHATQSLTAPDELPNGFPDGVLHTHQPSLLTNGWQESKGARTRYVDTAAYHLLRTGFTVRLDESDDHLRLTVENAGADLTGKVDKAIRRRDTGTASIACEDEALTFKSWPKTLRKTVASVLPKHANLQPILTMASQTEQPSAPAPFVRLAESLLAASRQAPGAPDQVGIQPQMLVADACRLIWQEQLMTMIVNEAGVRYSQERDYVHNMRVAIRRARAAAKLYGHFFPRKRIRPYLHFLRKTGRLLGQVRNLDVTLAKARRARTDEIAAQAPKKWVKAWRAQRKAVHEALVAWLDSSEYSNLLADFQAFCALPTAPVKHDLDPTIPQQVRHVVPMQIGEGFAAVRAYETLFADETAVAPEFLHNLRIACKHLRYNLEFVRHLLGPECEMMITRLKALQELLGDLNDAVIAQTLVDESKEAPDTLAYQQAQAELVEELRRQTPTAFAELVNQESREQLGRALARL